MRHSFLPNPEQKKLKREYRIRVAIIALFFLSGVGLIGSASLFPSYIQVNMEARQQQAVIASLKKDNDQSGLASLGRELKLHSIRMSALDAPATIPASVFIQNSLALRGSVSITGITVESVSTSTATLRIEGKAPTRDSLVVFKSRLEKFQPGTKVELPISELAKSKDIVFSLKVIQPLI